VNKSVLYITVKLYIKSVYVSITGYVMNMTLRLCSFVVNDYVLVKAEKGVKVFYLFIMVSVQILGIVQ